MTNAEIERVNGLGDTLHMIANSRKVDWDVRLSYAVFADVSLASTLDGKLHGLPRCRKPEPRPVSLG